MENHSNAQTEKKNVIYVPELRIELRSSIFGLDVLPRTQIFSGSFFLKKSIKFEYSSFFSTTLFRVLVQNNLLYFNKIFLLEILHIDGFLKKKK